MHLLLIRHALPERSEDGRGADPPLSELGGRMARRLPTALARFAVNRVVASPQLRALQTAQPVADALGLDVEVFEGLAEYDHGLSEYIPVEEMRAQRPEQLARLLDGHLPDGVDVEKFKFRVMSTVRSLVTAARREDTVAAFTHGGVINVVLQHALGAAKLFPFRIDYAAVSDLRCSPDGAPIVVGVNCIEHVPDLLPRLQKR